MTGLQPLYIDGKRDSRRRYVTPTGEIISRREQIRRTEGVTPEQKAIRRYEEGKAPEGITVRKARKKSSAPKKSPPSRQTLLPDYVMPTNGERGFFQLQGIYHFYNPTFRTHTTDHGYSTATAQQHTYGSTNYLILRRQAVLNAAAKLDGYEWKFTGVVEEKWLVW